MADRKLEVTHVKHDLAAMERNHMTAIQAVLDYAAKIAEGNNQPNLETLVGFAGKQQHQEDMVLVEAFAKTLTAIEESHDKISERTYKSRLAMRILSLGLSSSEDTRKAEETAGKATRERLAQVQQSIHSMLTSTVLVKLALLNRLPPGTAPEKPEDPVGLLENVLGNVMFNGIAEGVKVRKDGEE